MTKRSLLRMPLLPACLALLMASVCLPAVGGEQDKKKLKIVFLMGQSNMVGYAHPRTAWYLTQPMYVPPPKTADVKSEGYNSSQFYWSGLTFARGDSEEFNARGKALLAERRAIIKLWRSRWYDNFSRAAVASGKKPEWDTKAWGPPPQDQEQFKGMQVREFMPVFLGQKLKEAEVSKRMEDYIESPENKLHPKAAIGLIPKRDEAIAEDIKRVRKIFLKNTTAQDFDGLDEAVKDMGKVTDENRLAYAELVKRRINLPIAERTYISAIGAVAGEPTDNQPDNITQGRLSVGYSKFATNFGPEYPFGVSFEQMVDGPVLLIKCAWGGKSLKGDFRPPSLATEEEPTGKFWKLSMDHIRTVLADPGKYHPDYDPKAGHELAGLVWFQGWNDAGNKQYGDQLVSFIKDFRKELKAAKLPVVCGLLGHSSWPQTTFDGDVNSGMLYAAGHPDLKGAVDIVNTVKYYPVELNFKNAVKAAYGEDSAEYKKAEHVINRATSKDPVHYHGSAKFMFLAGDAMARKLVNLIDGGEPTIHKEAHLTEYTAKLETLKAEILKSLPAINETKLAAYQKARGAEVAAVAELDRSRKGYEEIAKWKKHIVDFNEKWIPMAEDKLREAKEALKTATDKAAAEAAVAKAEKDIENEKAGLEDRHTKLKKALETYPNIEEALKKAEMAQPKAEAACLAAANDLGLGKTLAGNKLDHQLAACHIMAHATPRGLADYAQQGSAQKQLIDDLLANGDLLVEIAVADGANDGKYGQAMEILKAIHASSSKSASDPTLKNLALGVALELAVPREQRNAVADTDAPEFVDPVKRYLAYEKAFLNKELDPCFDDLSVWDMRLVVNGEEPDHITAWGRQMLANYRPDHILTADERWRYVDLVRTEIRYGSQDNKFDEDELQFFQNILKNGGICGRRAFMGRFILRCFGVPVTGRPQPGHAALAHYTSDGWVVCLGAGWGKGSTHTPYKNDLDFLATTQARATGEDYKQVARAQWIGSAYGESRVYGFRSQREEVPFWNAIALYTQRELISKSEAETLAAVGEEIGEANQTKEKVDIMKVKLSDDDKKVKVADNGVITIPAAAAGNITESTEKVIFMPSNQGGLQMHYSRLGDPQPLEYTFEAAEAGKYNLTAKVCTPSWNQNLMISANGANPVKLELPHTVGMWETTAPITVELKVGKNVLTLNHQSAGYAKGFSIHRYVLTPLK